VGFELPKVVDVVAMASSTLAMASIHTDLMLTTFNGIDFEHFLAALKMDNRC